MAVADLIYLRELIIDCCLGVHAWEQQIQQPVMLDIELAFDIRKAARSDAIADTIDYAELVQAIRRLVSARKFSLLETLVESVADLILQNYPINWLRIKCNKVAAIANLKEVGICIERAAAR